MSDKLNSLNSDSVSCSVNKNNVAVNNGHTIRIKPVNEINSDITVDQTENKENSYSTNANKRKLPSWLFTPSTSKIDTNTELKTCSRNSKKRKISNSDKELKPDNQENEIVDSSSSNNEPVNALSTSRSDQNVNQGNESNENEDNANKLGVNIKQEIKEEPVTSSECTTTTDMLPRNDAVKEEASSTTRDTCMYGIKCYRRNPTHRIEMAHPGDSDYKRPNYPSPPSGTPDCPYGDRCYRRNPIHFQDYSHPPSTNFNKNREERKKTLKRKNQQAAKLKTKKKQSPTKQVNYNFDDEDDDDNDDPFLTDSDEDYLPSDDDDYSDDGAYSSDNELKD